jgi:hypothetical protein
MRTPWFAAAAVVAAPLALLAQQQQPSTPQRGWPCGARLDPSYFQVAEGTGGRLILLAPDELAESTPLLTAFTNHPQTIFRLAGSITPGLHDFHVPIDRSVESAVFSVSMQCLETVYVQRPDGTLVAGDDHTEIHSFRSERLAIVRQPEAGIWTIRVAGSGVAGVVVQARSPLGIAQLEFAPSPSAPFTAVPSFGVENSVKLRVSGRTSAVRASLVSGTLEPLGELTLAEGDGEGSYLSRFTPQPGGFRVLVAGKDADGFAFQRMHAPLYTPVR